MNGQQNPAKLGDLSAALRAASTATPSDRTDAIQRKRELVADLCRLLGQRMANVIPDRKQLSAKEIVAKGGAPDRNRSAAPSTILAETLATLSPRMRQTLEGLLAGDSEKQIAHKLSLSKHTIHVYVKALYKGFGVCSRGELLARFIPNTSNAVDQRGHSA